MMMNMQPAILPGVPRIARYLSFSLRPGAKRAESMGSLREIAIDESLVVGIGEPLSAHWGSAVRGLRTFPALSGPGVEMPSAQHALWIWLRGDDLGEIVGRSNTIAGNLDATFRLEEAVNAFKFGDTELGHDLTGYEDGTENPTDDDAVEAAFMNDGVEGAAGSSFVAVQQWVHDLKCFSSLPQSEQDNIIGRRLSDNEEIEDAPESAHVKRTEQESFDPAAFVVRRSMPFAESYGEGLMFVAFGKSLDAFEMQLRRMSGSEDGIPDALFRFSRAINGGYYWCPPVRDSRLDLRIVESD